MVTPKRVKNGTEGAGRISSVLVMVVWLLVGWSRPAFADEEGRHLKLAPIRLSSKVGGSLGYTYLSNNYGQGRSAMNALAARVTGDFRARSYFWQPWLALVSGGLIVDAYANAASYGPPPSSSNTRNVILTGEAALDLVKYSRFPFRAHAYKNENHTGGSTSGINSNFKNTGFDLTQNYQSKRGDYIGTAQYNHNSGGRASIGTEEVTNTLSFEATAAPSRNTIQTFHLTDNFNDITHPLLDDHLLTNLLALTHLYQPESTFSINTLVSLNKSDYTLKQGVSTLQQTNYDSQQLSSFASWRPIGSPLTVTSGLRLLRSEYSNNGRSSPTDYSNFNLGANYAWSTLLRTYGSINVYDDNFGVQTISTNAALAASKAFGEKEAINLGGFRYTRYASASVANATVTTNSNLTNPLGGATQTRTSSTQNLAGNLGHALNKSTNLGGGHMTTNLNQRLSGALSSRHTPYSHLTSAASTTWRISEGRAQTNFALRATDSRDLSGRQYYSQIINLQASRSMNLLHHQSLAGNLTIQTTRSGFRGSSSGVRTSPSANLQYNNQRLFAIRSLTFVSNLQITAANIISAQNSNPLKLSTTDTATTEWDNSFEYFIGKLRIKLQSHLAVVNDHTQSLLYFHVVRSF